ncbi:MAG: AraC family transcriptional regulator [Calothrix sp. FI2-JRJ7]|jgi:AraC family transcriptional regulator|nr:AraC family transcriptional regulator [Calothrix sp. FI2-JRJ7]
MKPTPCPQPRKITYSSEEGLIISSQDLGWESIVVKEYWLPPAQGSYQAFPQHDLTLCLAPRPLRIQQVMGEQRYTGVYSKGDICITPAGLAGGYHAEGEDHFLQIQIEPHFLEKVAQEAGNIDLGCVELLPKFRVRHPQIEQIIMMLHSELKNGDSWGSKLYIESLTNALAVNLLRDYSTKKDSIALYPGGLSEHNLLVVTDYINDNLTTEIKLSDLSGLVGISQFHFSRLFKQSMGVTPHQYLIAQRIERAKFLLKNSKLSVTEIAFSCGFNSHSHLGKYFRQLTGMAPNNYRKS